MKKRINDTVDVPENKSIWDWDLYHKIRGTNSIITNKLKIRKEILNETNFKEYIKEIINNLNKKSAR